MSKKEKKNKEEIVEEKEAIVEVEVKKPKSHKGWKIFLGIFIFLILLLATFVTVDIISVSKYEKGPYFAILTKRYKDGGTREYTGLGYKVIKYNQVQGRRDIELGSWRLKYNNTPITIQDVDLAIETLEDGVEAYEKYHKKFVRIHSTLHKVDTKKKQLTIGYIDDGGKYTLDIICKMVEEQENLEELETGKEITIIGTLKEYKEKSKKNNNTYIIENCFAEQ